MKEDNYSLQPPQAAKIEKVFKEHDNTRIDNYYWLNQREDSAVLDYLNSENDYLDKVMEHTNAFQEKLYEEIVGRIKKDDSSVPAYKNGYWYYTKYVEGGEYPVYCRKEGSLEAEEQVMLDGNKMAKGYSFFAITGTSVSPDNKMLVYGIDTVSRRKYTLHFKNLETGETLAENIPVTSGRASWANDNKTIFFATKDDKTLRTDRVHRYQVGSPDSKEEVYYETDNTFSIGVGKTLSGKYLAIASYSTLSSEFRILAADNPQGEFQLFAEREADHLYSIAHHEDKFYIVSNKDAKNFRVMSTYENATSSENWQEVIAHRPETLIEDVTAFKNYMVIEERTNALNQIRVINFTNNEEHYIQFDEQAYTAYTTGNREYNSNTLRFRYQSMTTPGSTYDYNMESKERELKKRVEVIGDFDPANYVTERVFANARDGVKVPVTMVYRKGMKKDSTNPTLLYAYGSYGSTSDP
jgi:oligopeptidase B